MKIIVETTEGSLREGYTTSICALNLIKGLFSATELKYQPMVLLSKEPPQSQGISLK